MKRELLIVAALVLAVAGCTSTVTVNPLYHELAYQSTPAPAPELTVDKSIAILPFEDGRMYMDTNKDSFQPAIVNLIPGFWKTKRVDGFPEVVANMSVWGMGHRTYAAGTLADAMPKLLADYLHRSRRFSKAVYVEAAEVAKTHDYDYVLRATLVQSKLTTTRYSYCIGPFALVPYALAAPTMKYSADLQVEWQVFDNAGRPVGLKETTQLEMPVAKYAGFYYGWSADHKDAPLGLYIKAIKAVNAAIADGISAKIAK